jgi:hypothetical protein
VFKDDDQPIARLDPESDLPRHAFKRQRVADRQWTEDRDRRDRAEVNGGGPALGALYSWVKAQSMTVAGQPRSAFRDDSAAAKTLLSPDSCYS